jgi:RHS repeat-associated protein
MKCSAVSVICLLACVVARAQGPATGFPMYGSMEGSTFDAVNHSDLNTNFTIPVMASHGRGIVLNLAIASNSAFWRQSGGTWVSMTDASGNPTWGWTKPVPAGILTQTITTTQCEVFPQKIIYYYDVYSNVWYYDSEGTGHYFPTVTYDENPCTGQLEGTNAGYAGDGSGFYFNNGTLIAPSGGYIAPNTQIYDTNGNYLAGTVINGSEIDWKDSAGHVALKIITGTSSIQYEVLGPNGAYQTTTVNLTSTNIKTNFGCSGVTEFTGTASLPTSISLPNGQSYTFTYESTPSHSGYYTGRVLRVTLPTGGYFEYDYPSGSGQNDGVNCADGTIVNMSRKVSDGTNVATWKYARNVASSTTTVTIPQLADTSSANDIVYTFNSSGQEISRKIYSNSPGTNLLRTINTTWASNGTPSTQVVIMEDNSTQSEVDTSFDTYGNLLSKTEYDWGSGAHGSAIRTTTFSYLHTSDPNYVTYNIVNRVSEKLIKDGSGTIQYRQDIGYDETIPLTSCPTGAAQHFDAGYPCSFKYRGNATSVKTYKDPVTPATPVTQNLSYDWFGNVISTSIDSVTQVSRSYSSLTQYSQPDSVTAGSGPTLTTTTTYNTYSGQPVTGNDANSQPSNYFYDTVGRMTSLERPDGTSLLTGYNDTTLTTTTTVPIDSSKSVQKIVVRDGLGRVTLSKVEDVSNNVYSIISTNYDLLGRAYKTSNPYTTSPSYWTTTLFDALGRVTSTTTPDGSATTYSYSLNTVTVTDPASKKRKSVTDAAGRVTSIYEPDSGNSLTVQTSYTYTILDALATVTEGSQTRTFNYDKVGRLTSSVTPEAGTVSYVTNDFNLVTQRTDARNVVTNYTYDGLNRLIGTSYTIPNGSGVAAMPNVCDPTGGTNNTANVCNYYDQGGAGIYALGRLTKMVDPSGSVTYSYNKLGQTTQVQRVVGSTTYTTSYQYNLMGETTQTTYPSGRVVQQSVDPIGRLCAVAQTSTSCSSNTNPFASGFAYNTASETTGFNYGNGVVATFGYSPDRLQLTSITDVKGASTLFSLSYAYGAAGANNGQIAGITDNVDNGRTVNYTYDNLSRLNTAVTVGSTNYAKWGLSFTYDRYGNRTAQTVTSGTGPSNSVTVSATTNRITTSGYSYDASGNMTNDGSNTLTYDGENRTITSSGSLGSGTYTYDGNGLRVKKVSGSTTTVSIYSSGKIIAEYLNGAAPSSPTNEYIYGAGQLIAAIQNGTIYYHHNDHLSLRVRTNSTGGIQDQRATYPFGESWYATASNEWTFTNYQRDSESGNDYAWARYDMNRLGRFSSPDPVRGNTSDPQSLNRYTYVSNDPINHSDPTGLCKGGLLVVGDHKICSSGRPLGAPPDGAGGWLGGEYCGTDPMCLLNGGSGQGAFSSPIANPNNPIYSQDDGSSPQSSGADPASDPSTGTSTGQTISVPGELVALQEQLLGFAVTEVGINGDGNVDSVSIWSQNSMNFGDISVVPNSSQGVTIGFGYDSSDAGSGMYIGIYGGAAKMDQGSGFTAWMTSLEFTGGRVTGLTGGVYFGGYPYSSLSVAVPGGQAMVQNGINNNPAAIGVLNAISGQFSPP